MPLVINGQRIDDAVLNGEFANIKSYFESLGNVSCCERDPEFRGYARQNIVARVLLAQEAQRALPPTPPDDVEAALGATPDQLDLVRRDLEADLRVRRLVEGLSDGDAEPTDTNLRRFYDEHLDYFKTAEEVRASHILKSARGEKRHEAYEELRQLRKRLQAGENFEDVARKHSDKADEHIDLGFFKRGELAEEFEVVAFSLDVGEISPIFATPFGYHLITVTERKPATPKPFDEVRPQVLELVLAERRQEKTRKLVEELQARATIEEVEEESVHA